MFIIVIYYTSWNTSNTSKIAVLLKIHVPYEWTTYLRGTLNKACKLSLSLSLFQNSIYSFNEVKILFNNNNNNMCIHILCNEEYRQICNICCLPPPPLLPASIYSLIIIYTCSSCSVNGKFFRDATCAEVREKGDTTVSNLSNIHFFIMIIIIFTFSPPSTLVARSAWQGNHTPLTTAATSSPVTAIVVGASFLDFRTLQHRNWTIIFPISFRHGLDLSGFCDFFSKYYLLHLSKAANKTSSTVPRRPPARRSKLQLPLHHPPPRRHSICTRRTPIR